jgi:hypothetical protein
VSTERLQASGPLVIIACGWNKLPHRAPAAELYTGHSFGLGLRAARVITTNDRIRTLSGKYGLVELGHILEPYEQPIDAPGGVTSAAVAAQAAEQGLLGEHPMLLLPAPYDAVAVKVWPYGKNPLRGAPNEDVIDARLEAIADGRA